MRFSCCGFLCSPPLYNSFLSKKIHTTMPRLALKWCQRIVRCACAGSSPSVIANPMRAWTKKSWTFVQKLGAFEKKFPIFLSKFTTSDTEVSESEPVAHEIQSHGGEPERLTPLPQKENRPSTGCCRGAIVHCALPWPMPRRVGEISSCLCW